MTDAIVFVSRQIPSNGSVYYPQGGSMPGVQPYSRFQVAAPGKLIIREANGTLRVLIDGSKPTAASLNLIDVNAPDVSYDAKKIVFAGLPAGNYPTGAVSSPGAWRIYVINVDGTGLRQITFSDRNISLSQFGSVASNFTKYDDTDPVWLPDGRIVFSSTRWPSFGQYGAALTSNLYVVNADGTNLHRITAERNGAERPVIDPLTGKIVYSRWWRNFRLGTNNMATIPYSGGGYIMKDGVCALKFQGAECQEAGGLTNLERNAWHLASINPDGTGLAQFAGRSNSFFVGESVNHAYGGAFAPDGTFYANFFPMTNGTEAAGFGGIRKYQRGANGYTHVIGITNRDESVQRFVSTNPTSYGVFVGNYAADPAVLPDGGLLISWAQDTRQDYGLYLINADGSGRTLVYDNPGTTELRAKLVRARPLPPIIPDQVTQVASALPPTAQGPYDKDGTFTFNALNVYFNAPVDVDILSAPPVGSANTIRFYTDFQRDQQRGSFEFLDWPIFLKEVPVNPDGSVMTSSPANIPLFEQLRTSPEKGYTIPLTGRGVSPDEMGGAAHVAGMNFGRTGEVQRCVGCHAGHTMIPVPADPQWTNLAPGATVTYSSLHSSLPNGNGAVDRKVKLRIAYNNHYRFWLSREGQNPNTQWLQLTFPVPVTVRTVRLYDMPASESNVNVNNTTVRLYSDAAGKNQVASKTSGALSESGTDVTFNDVRARVVRIEFTSVSGSTAGLAEVEVIARGEADVPFLNIVGNAGAADVKLSYPEGEAISDQDGNYTIQVPSGWSGTVTPSHPCYTFTPASRTYTNVTANQTGQNYTAAFNPTSSCANVNVNIGSNLMGTYAIPSGSDTRLTYNASGGPVKVESTNGVNIVSAIRLQSYANNTLYSFVETMGVPQGLLSYKYVFPTYNNTWAPLNSQIRVSNLETTPTTVRITIGSSVVWEQQMQGLEEQRLYFPVSGGPVIVESLDTSKKIVAAIRLQSYANNLLYSFSETMGIPDQMLSYRYYFPTYNNTWAPLNSQIRVSNLETTPTTVRITIGSSVVWEREMQGREEQRLYFPVSGGPVIVESLDTSKKIVAAIRLQSYANNILYSFVETMGVPEGLLSYKYYFPTYNNTWTPLNSQIRVSNLETTPTTVRITIGSSVVWEQQMQGREEQRLYFPVSGGPVIVESLDTSKKIVAAIRLQSYANNTLYSFSETMGIPLEQMSSVFYFPTYNNTWTPLNSQLRFGVP
ncbi:MAG: DUF7402 domain-containing protein [Chloroflexota bacterium]